MEDNNGKITESEVQPGISTTVSKVFKESGLAMYEAAKKKVIHGAIDTSSAVAVSVASLRSSEYFTRSQVNDKIS